MFDIGFWELAIITVVALLVIGPERLPAVARTLGFWLGKARRFVASVQDDFQREVVKAEELKRLVEEQSKIRDVHEILEHTVDDSRKTVSVGAKLDREDDTHREKAATPELGAGGQQEHDKQESNTNPQPDSDDQPHNKATAKSSSDDDNKPQPDKGDKRENTNG